MGIGAAVVAVGLLMLIPVIGWYPVVPVAVAAGAVGALLLWPARRFPGMVWVPLIPAAVSLLWSGGVVAEGMARAENDAGLAGAVELACLLVLLWLTVRWANGWGFRIVAPVVALAQATWILRFIPDRTTLSLIGGCALFAVGSAAVITWAASVRKAEARRMRHMQAARAEQRRQLERDLHDYVAHDVSGIIAQAQAARFAGADDTASLHRSLQRIEEAGLEAMRSMDAMLELLREDQLAVEGRGDVHAARPTLDDLEGLVEAFRESWPGEVTVRLDPREGLDIRLSELLYRVASEALTNVRRHAPADADVTVRLIHDPSEDAMRLTVEDVGGSETPSRPNAADRGGTGIRDLRERMALIGGRLDAHATPDGWVTTATVPTHPARS